MNTEKFVMSEKESSSYKRQRLIHYAQLIGLVALLYGVGVGGWSAFEAIEARSTYRQQHYSKYADCWNCGRNFWFQTPRGLTVEQFHDLDYECPICETSHKLSCSHCGVEGILSRVARVAEEVPLTNEELKHKIAKAKGEIEIILAQSLKLMKNTQLTEEERSSLDAVITTAEELWVQVHELASTK